MTHVKRHLATLVAAGSLAFMVSVPGAAQAPSGATASGGPYTIEMPWGTFTLDPAIQARVAQKVAAGQPLDIPVFIWITGDEFFVPVRAGIAQAAKDLNTTSQLLGPVEPNQPQMISDIQSYLSRQPDGIALSPANPDDVQGLVDEMIGTGLPVVVWNTDIPKSKELAYVGQDNTKAGYEVGKLMAKALMAKGVSKGTIAMFATDATAAYSKDLRFPGFRQAVSEALPDITFAEPVTVTGDISKAIGIVDAAVRGKSDVVGMYSADEQVTALGTWAMQNAGPDDYVITGHNKLARELELMKDGWIDGLVGQDPYYQGYGSVQFLHQFLTTGTTPCGPVCDSGYPVVDTPELAQQLLDSKCDGKGCG